MRTHHAARKRGHAGIIGLVAVFTAIVVISLATQVPSSPPPLRYLSSLVPTPTVFPFMDQQAVKQSLADKQAQQQADDERYQAALNGPQGSKDLASAPTNIPWTPNPPQYGIFDNPGPLPAGSGSVYDFVNRWHGLVNDLSTHVLAGAALEANAFGAPTDDSQGVVVVERFTDTYVSGAAQEEYRSPYRCGPLKVIAEGPVTIGTSKYGSYRVVAGGHLLLVSTTLPSWFEFDVANRVWTGYGVRISAGSNEVYQDADLPCAAPNKVPSATSGYLGPPNPVPPNPVPTVPPQSHYPELVRN